MSRKWAFEDPVTVASARRRTHDLYLPPRRVDLRHGDIEIDETTSADILRIRTPRGDVRIAITDDGPRVWLVGVDVEIAATSHENDDDASLGVTREVGGAALDSEPFRDEPSLDARRLLDALSWSTVVED